MKRSLVSLVAIVSFIGIHISTANAEDAGIFVPVSNTLIAKTVTIRNVTSTSAEVSWAPNITNTEIKWGTDVSHLSLQPTSDCRSQQTESTHHCRQLKNLQPNTTYYFRIPTTNGYNGFLYLVGGSFVTRSDDTSTAVASSTITVDRMPPVGIITVSSSTPEDYQAMQAIVTAANNKILENSQKYVVVTTSSEAQVESKNDKPTITSASLASSSTEIRPGFLIRIWSFVTSLFN